MGLETHELKCLPDLPDLPENLAASFLAFLANMVLSLIQIRTDEGAGNYDVRHQPSPLGLGSHQKKKSIADEEFPRCTGFADFI